MMYLYFYEGFYGGAGMLLKQIRYFVMVVECNSFTEAAECNYISQSAISQQIKALEDELGVKLLQRWKRRFRLTEAGEYMYIHGKELLAQADLLREEVIKIGKSASMEHIVIGYLKLYIGRELQTAISSFCRQYPEVIVDVNAAGHEELYKGLLNGRYDFILNDTHPKNNDNFEYKTVRESEIFIDVPIKSQWGDKEFVNVSENMRLLCIIVAGSGQRSNEAAFYNTLFYKKEAELIFASDWAEARMLAAAGKGFLLVENDSSIFAPADGTKRLPFYKNGKQVKLRYYLVWRKGNDDKYEKYLAETVLKEFAGK